MSTVSSKPKPATHEEIVAALRLFAVPDHKIEVRTISPDGRSTPRHFAQIEDAAKHVARVATSAKGVYVPLNPFAWPLGKDDEGKQRKGAGDADITRRVLLLIDCDPIRPDAESSATDEEKAASRAKAEAIREYLRAEGWPEPMMIDSGNGTHLLYRIDLPNDDDAKALVKAVLVALADRFDDDVVKVDPKVFNASRITKLPGTIAAKGEHTAERPHRRAELLHIPLELVAVPVEKLQELAATVAEPFDLGATIDAARERAEAHNGHANGNGHARPNDRARTPTDNLPRRIEAYLAKCDPAVSGQKGHNKAFSVACKIGPGFDLPPEEAYSWLLNLWNPRCDPSWSESELRHKVEEAYKIEKRRGWLRDADRPGYQANGRTSAKPDAGAFAPHCEATADRRPVIRITTHESQVNDDAVESISSCDDIYQRAYSLVTVLRDMATRKRKKNAARRPGGTPMIAGLALATLREKMSLHAQWEKFDKRSEKWEPAHPPDWSVSAVTARRQWPKIRPLEGVIEAPTIRPDGSILSVKGYDDETGLLYEPNGKFDAIPERPTREQARAAVEILYAIVVNFPFANLSHRAAWLAALLTVIVRHAIEGPSPLFLFDANTPGSGKSKLCDIIAIIATGREMARVDYPEKEEEMAKLLLATAIANDLMVLFDNVPSGFSIGGKSLDRTLTSGTTRGRVLGKSEMTPDLPVDTVFFATGNNLGTKGDSLRRVGLCRLESTLERPEERRDFAIKGDLLAHVRQERPRLLAAALTIIRAYVIAGRPDQGLTPIDYPAWSSLVRNAVHWATDTDPCETRKELVASDPGSAERDVLVFGWRELPGGDVSGLTAAKAIQILEMPENKDNFATLRGVFESWGRGGKMAGPRTIGMKLKAIQRRVIKGLYFDSETKQGTQVWTVCGTPEPE